jgi:hypothetical protein
MLINLSNHPSHQWQPAQKDLALEKYGSVIDIPFPQLDPMATMSEILLLAKQHVEKCSKLLKETGKETHAIHIMGEHTFVYAFVRIMQQNNITCIASTTHRLASIDENGNKTSRFEFCQFRKYPKI